MEAALRLLTKEALRDHNFGQTFFDNGLPGDEGIVKEADLAKTNRLAFKFFARHSEIRMRKQVKEAKTMVGRLMVSAMEEYDDVMTGMHLEPDSRNLSAQLSNAEEEAIKKSDPDKIFKTHPSFDPVFMKV